MRDDIQRTGRAVLRGAAGTGPAGLGLTPVDRAADPFAQGNFARICANDTLYRTNVVYVLDDRPNPEDTIYFVHDGEQPIVANDTVAGQGSPFVSGTEPGDRDYHGGQWTHISTEVTDTEAFSTDAPLTSPADVMEADYIETESGDSDSVHRISSSAP